MTGIERTSEALTVIPFKIGVDNLCLFKHTKTKFQSSCTVYNNRVPIRKQNIMKIFLFVYNICYCGSIKQMYLTRRHV